MASSVSVENDSKPKVLADSTSVSSPLVQTEGSSGNAGSTAVQNGVGKTEAMASSVSVENDSKPKVLADSTSVSSPLVQIEGSSGNAGSTTVQNGVGKTVT